MDKQSGGRRLNHVEFVHRPGEDKLVVGLFEALGCPCRIIDDSTFGIYVVVELDGSPHGLNDIFVSPAEAEQLALEDALRDQMTEGETRLARLSADFRALQIERPYRASHVGLRMPSVAALDDAIVKLGEVFHAEHLARIAVGAPIIRTQQEAEATMAPVKQVWFWTDVVSTGLLAVGQQFELQAYSG